MLQLRTDRPMNSKRTTVLFLSALLVLVLLLAIVITLPFLKPFAFAVILAVVFEPLHEWILRVTKQRHGVGALLSTLGVLVLFGVPAFVITTLAANEAMSAAHYLSRRSAEEGGFSVLVTTLAAGPVHLIGRWIDLSKYDLRAIISSNAQKVSIGMFGFGAAVLSNLARFAVDSLITFVILFFLFREGKDWAYRAGRLIPLSPVQVARLYANISDTIIANVYGILTVGAAQGVLTGIAMRIVGNAFIDIAWTGGGTGVDHSGGWLRPDLGTGCDLPAGHGRDLERRVPADLGPRRGQQYRQRSAALGGGRARGIASYGPAVLHFGRRGGVWVSRIVSRAGRGFGAGSGICHPARRT